MRLLVPRIRYTFMLHRFNSNSLIFSYHVPNSKNALLKAMGKIKERIEINSIVGNTDYGSYQ